MNHDLARRAYDLFKTRGLDTSEIATELSVKPFSASAEVWFGRCLERGLPAQILGEHREVITIPRDEFKQSA